MLNNIPLKLFSVFLAILLWMTLVTGEFQEVSLYAPVKLTNIPEGYVAVTDEHLINIYAKGPKSIVNDERFSDVQVEIDLSHMKPGYNNTVIDVKNIKMPPGIQVVNIQPKNIEITVDSLIKTKMKVTPTFIGEPAEGYKVGSVVVYPESVEVKAARSKIFGQNTVETLPVNLSGKRDPITYSIGLKKYDGIQESYPELVEIFVVFKEDMQEKDFKEMTVKPQNIQGNFNAVIKDKIKIKVKGRVDLLDEGVVLSELRPYVDLGSVRTKGKYLRQVKFKESDLFEVIDFEPAKVRLEVFDEEILRN
jgi:hypothetical protein